MTEINQTNTVRTEIQTLICSLANVGQNTHFHDFVSLCCLKRGVLVHKMTLNTFFPPSKEKAMGSSKDGNFMNTDKFPILMYKMKTL